MTNYDLDAMADIIIANPQLKESLMPIMEKMIQHVKENVK